MAIAGLITRNKKNMWPAIELIIWALYSAIFEPPRWLNSRNQRIKIK